VVEDVIAPGLSGSCIPASDAIASSVITLAPHITISALVKALGGAAACTTGPT
jgi:hypothetical protein